MVPTVNSKDPAIKMDFLPITSDQRPAGNRNTVLAMMYALRVHSPVMTVVLSPLTMRGRPITTMVASTLEVNATMVTTPRISHFLG